MYDADARPEQFLRAYAEEFGSVEIDSTFYGTPDPERVERWARTVPADFRFALKLPRQITHDRKLFASAALLREFFASANRLGEKLAAVLVQLPAAFVPDDRGMLERFLPELPASVRVAVEFRDARWYEPPLVDEILALFAAHSVALALTDGPFVSPERGLELVARPSAVFHYLRWLGGGVGTMPRVDRVVIDRSAAIARWCDALRIARVSEVFGYANNSYEGHSPATLRSIYARMGIPHVVPHRIRQTSLFG